MSQSLQNKLDLDAFNSLFKIKESLNSHSSGTSTENKCLHTNVIFNQYNKICLLCGEEVNQDIIKTHIDSERCNIRKECEKNISNDVRYLNISSKVVQIANDLFVQMINNNIRRGSARRSIIFACVFQAYKITGNPQNPHMLMELFRITKKAGMKGMKYLNKHVPKTSQIRFVRITPVDNIRNIIHKFGSTPEQEDEIIQIFNSIREKSSILNRSRPLSVAAGVVYFWIEKNKPTITLDDFVKKVNMSAITIKKITKEVCRIFNICNL